MNESFNVISIAQVEDIAAGDKNFIKELVDIFLSQIPDFSSKILSAYKTENWMVLAREAHTAKSSVMTFGMEETAKLLKKIQINCEKSNLTEVPEMVNKVISDLDAAIPELEKLKQSY